MYTQTRGGTRGGAAEFKWSDVGADKDREHYLGHSINAPTGRWQKNKDVHWYNRDQKDGEFERAEERRKIKEAEEDALAAALGFAPVKRIASGEDASADAPAKSAEEKEAEKEEKRRRKEEKRQRKEEKRERKERRRAERDDRHRHDRDEHHRHDARDSRPRSRSREGGRRRRSLSMSRSRSPPPRRDVHRLHPRSPPPHPMDRSPRDRRVEVDDMRSMRRWNHSRSPSRSRSPPRRRDLDERRSREHEERPRGD